MPLTRVLYPASSMVRKQEASPTPLDLPGSGLTDGESVCRILQQWKLFHDNQLVNACSWAEVRFLYLGRAHQRCKRDLGRHRSLYNLQLSSACEPDIR